MIFISYSSKDRATVLQICQFLRDRRIEYWMDNDAIEGGDSFPEEIEKALYSCSFFVIFLSETSMKSQWVRKELITAINREKPVIPLRLDTSPLAEGYSYLISDIQLINYAENKDSVNSLLKILEKGPSSAESYNLVRVPSIRFRPSMQLSGFTGRRDDLEWIDAQIKKDDGPVYVTGMGGIGKSMLAQKYARDHDNEYICAWVVYDTSLFHTIAQMEFAGEHLSEDKSEEDVYRKHMESLTAYGKDLLLVIDNFDGQGNTESFDDLLFAECQNGETNNDILKRLSGDIRILITTRTDPGGICRELGKMPANELLNMAKQICFKIDWTESAEQSMLNIIDLVDGHTMMVALIAAAVNKSLRKDVSVMENLIRDNQFAKSREKVSARNYKPGIRDASFDSHMKVVFKFEDFDQKQKELLRTLSFVPAQGISLDFFMNLADVSFKREYMEDTLTLFRDLHLIAIEKKRIMVHTLISHYLAEELEPDYENCRMFVDKVLKSYNPKELRPDYGVLKELAPLEETIAERIRNREKQDDLYFDAGDIYYVLAAYEPALKSYEKALEIRKQIFPDNSTAIAISYNSIGETLRVLGRSGEALENYKKSLGIFERTLPAIHPIIAICHNNIGAALSELGRLDEALESLEKVLAIEEQTLPHDHPDIALSYNNIGEVLRSMGRLNEALENQEKALAIRDRILPHDHMEMAISYNNIGITLKGLGNLKEALDFYKKALAIEEQTLPSDHPLIAASYNNIGVALQSLGNLKEALDFYKKALAIRERTLPSDHPDIAHSYISIGEVLRRMGCPNEALENQEKALGILKLRLPSDHPDIATCYNNIGAALSNLGRQNEALVHFEKALAIKEQTLPPDHPDIALSYINIGAVLQGLGRLNEALENLEKALAIRERTLPPDHPDIALSYNNISQVLNEMGRHKEAEENYAKAMEIMRRHNR